MNTPIYIFSLIVVDTILLIIGFIAAYYIWFKNLGAEVPDERSPPVKNVRKHFQRRAFTLSSRSLGIIVDKYFDLLFKFDSEYWIRHCGIEAFVFLLFQRTIFKLFGIMAILSICVSIPINVFTSTDDNWTLENLFIRTTLNNKTMTGFTSWFHVGLLVGFSLYSFRTIFQLKEVIKKEYEKEFLIKSKKHNKEWLKAHTVHIIGIPQSDRKGLMITKYLNNYLKPVGGKVLGVVIQPDFENIFRLEIQRKEVEEVSTMLQSKPIDNCFKCFLPSYLKNPEQLKITMNEIDNDIQKATEKPFLASGHGFVCFDSACSMQYCVKEFKRMGIFDTIQMVCLFLKDKFNSCFTSTRSRTTSTFGKYIEMDIEAERQINTGEYSDMVKIVIERANEAMDINWRNITDDGSRGFYICRRLFLNLCAILILVFLSTPTVIFSTIENVLSKQKYIKDLVSIFANFAQDFIVPLLILGLNQLLLLLIAYSAKLEKHSTYSGYQYSVFSKSLFYLMLNMFIIPAVSLATAGNPHFDLLRILIQHYSEEQL